MRLLKYSRLATITQTTSGNIRLCESVIMQQKTVPVPSLTCRCYQVALEACT